MPGKPKDSPALSTNAVFAANTVRGCGAGANANVLIGATSSGWALTRNDFEDSAKGVFLC